MEIGRSRHRMVSVNLPEASVQEALEKLKTDRIIKRIWERDYTVWGNSPEEISNRLGWLNSHGAMAESLESIEDFVEEVRSDSYARALLLGMGGSSMAPEVFRKIFGVREGYLDLEVLDSTDPGAVLEKEKKFDPHKTLFIVSTKSGGTVETTSLMKYFYNKALKSLGREDAGKHFIAITDPESSLEKTAKELGFRKIFLNDPDIGGRYSALSYFGLVPAALIGADLEQLLDNADAMACNAEASNCPLEKDNTPAWLGVALGALGSGGHDKVTLVLSPPIKPFGAWLDQLIAESTGKEGTGLLPVDGETLASPEFYGSDRLFIYLRLKDDPTYDKALGRLKEAGQPVIQLNLHDRYALGGEFFRWMMAAAVAGWALGINPFDQPNVESAKVLARDMVSAYRDKGELPSASPDLTINGIEVFYGPSAENLHQAWINFFGKANPGKKEGKGRSYISIQAYLKPEPETDCTLQGLQDKIQTSSRMAVTVGYGPRFLHSTGQLHKGDAGNGLFIQLTAETPGDLPIPDQPGEDHSSISFGILKRAQAMGDRQALLDAGREVIRFHLDGDIPGVIKKLTKAIPVLKTESEE